MRLTCITIEERDVIIEVDQVKNCNCRKSEFYILQGRTFQFTDELTCNNCLGQISYARIPLEIFIENWQRHCQRVYKNWLDSSFFEEEAYAELTNYKNGKLNIEGEKIRNQLAEYFKIPVYLYHFSYELENDQSCLLCGSEGIESGLIAPSRICKKCNTIFGFEK